MDIAKKSRTELKAYFVKNAIPTESNFADLIDAMLNQKEDGVAKPAGNPLCIEASGDANSLKKAINFYNSFNDTDPAWAVSLNPREKPGDPNTANAGFAITDAKGNNRLFIDSKSGNVGVGTLTPSRAKLQVSGMVGNTVGMFGDLGISLVAAWPNVGFNCYYSGGWKSISAGYAGNMAVNQNNGSMEFLLPPAKAGAADAALAPTPCLSISPDGTTQIKTLKAENVFGGPFRLGAGKTNPGSTAWQAYGTNGIYLDVDTKAAGFTQTPLYITAIGGNSNHWATIGATSIYSAGNGSFRVYVRWADGSALTPAQANSLGWHIVWIGIQV